MKTFSQLLLPFCVSGLLPALPLTVNELFSAQAKAHTSTFMPNIISSAYFPKIGKQFFFFDLLIDNNLKILLLFPPNCSPVYCLNFTIKYIQKVSTLAVFSFRCFLILLKWTFTPSSSKSALVEVISGFDTSAHRGKFSVLTYLSYQQL